MADIEMPIFTRTLGLLSWLLPATNHFPRAQRHSATQRLLDAAFDLRDGWRKATCAGVPRASSGSNAPTRPWRGPSVIIPWHDDLTTG